MVIVTCKDEESPIKNVGTRVLTSLSPLQPYGSCCHGYQRICLIDLKLNVPVNSYGHDGALPPFYGTFTQN